MPTCANMCRHVSTPVYMPTCTDMCHHMPTFSVPVRPLISTLFTCRHPWMCWHVLETCAGMYQHVTSLSAPLIPIIWTIYGCWHVSPLVEMLIWSDMCSHLPTCNNDLCTYDTNYLDLMCILACVQANMCWHVSTCADKWVPTCDNTFGTSDTNYFDLTYMLAYVSTWEMGLFQQFIQVWPSI